MPRTPSEKELNKAIGALSAMDRVTFDDFVKSFMKSDSVCDVLWALSN
jgi:hypothetical protein